MLSVVPSENVSLWVVVPIAAICVPLLVYLRIRLRRLKRGRNTE